MENFEDPRSEQWSPKVGSNPSVNFINVLLAAFVCADPESAKNTYS